MTLSRVRETKTVIRSNQKWFLRATGCLQVPDWMPHDTNVNAVPSVLMLAFRETGTKTRNLEEEIIFLSSISFYAQ